MTYDRVARGQLHHDRVVFAMLLARIHLKLSASDSTYDAEFQHFLRGQEGLPLGNVASKMEGLTNAQSGALMMLARLTPFRKLGDKVKGNAVFKQWLDSVTAEQDVPELWDVDKPLSECLLCATKTHVDAFVQTRRVC